MIWRYEVTKEVLYDTSGTKHEVGRSPFWTKEGNTEFTRHFVACVVRARASVLRYPDAIDAWGVSTGFDGGRRGVAADGVHSETAATRGRAMASADAVDATRRDRERASVGHAARARAQVAFLNVLIVMQDWDFPDFSEGEIKISALDIKALKFEHLF